MGVEVPGLDLLSLYMGVQALLPAPGQIQIWWCVWEYLMGPRLLERIRTSCSKCRNTSRSGSGPQCGQTREAAAERCEEGRRGRVA